MNYLNTIDYTIIIVYFGCLVALSFYLKKLASASLDDYFLGGRRLPWWALGISGMASFLDITGTMIIVSFLYMLGPRGIFIEFRGGAVLALVIMLLWTGKWHRRSGCMTGAEWMIYRFGSGAGAQFARIISAIAVIIGTIGMLAYMITGVGMFLSMFIPLSPLQCSLIMIGIATVYTMASGFYGVVFTDLFQSGIILIAVIGISAMAIMKVTSAEALAALAFDVTGTKQWLSSTPHWFTSMPKGYEAYRHLFMFAMFYLLKNMFAGAGSGADPKYFGATSDRQCGKLTFLWTWLMMFRWPMMMAFAILGLFLVKEMFPDQTVLLQSAELIKTQLGAIEPAKWAATLADIMNNPGNFPEITSGLQTLLGDTWATKLHLLSFEGTVNPEKILPAVILFEIPMGFRGLILVALIAASMSTFDSTLNSTTGYFTRDIYQRYLRPKAKTKELIYASWAFGLVIVIISFLFAFTIKSINDIWGWIIMGLGGGLLMPSILRLYWWRFNAGGFATGTACGLVGAIVQRTMFPGLDERLQFLILVMVGLIGAIIGTYLTKPTERNVLENFYKTTRPFGLWKPLLHILDPNTRTAMLKEHKNDLLALPFTLGWQITLFMIPMQLVTRTYGPLKITLTIFIISLTGMYFFWYKNLPPEPDKKTE